MKIIFTAFIAVSCAFLFSSCSGGGGADIDYRNEMRSFVGDISRYMKDARSGFIVIPQNGHELVQDDGTPNTEYLSSIDGLGQEDLYYGYDTDDQATNPDDTGYLTGLLDIALTAGKCILVTDYCSTQSKVDDSFSKNEADGYLSFQATSRNLDVVPSTTAAGRSFTNDTITSLSDARNFLYLINPDFAGKAAFISAVQGTKYDAVIVDLFYDNTALTAADVEALRQKSGGGERLVICYMSIGEAEDYRYYWPGSWNTDPPSWLDGLNPDWPGNYKVQYWNREWQSIIYGNDSSYAKKILDAGFDGVYLDIIDAFDYFENK